MDFLVGLGVSIITEIAKYTVAPIQRQLGYLYYYQQNIDNLNSQIKKLEDKEKGIGDEVEKAQSRGKEPTKNVDDWRSEVKKVCQEAEEFQRKSNCEKMQCSSCSGSSSPNLLLRRKLSREAQQMVQTITCVIEKANQLGEISYLPCLRSSFKNRDFVTSDTRMQTLEEIMKALKDPTHRMIGVYGVGGIGKTTLVKEVAKIAQEEELYSKVVMVTMSQTFDISEKQKEIIEMLDLEKCEETVSTRAQRLKQGLRNQKKVLIVLDDIWDTKVPDLSEIGIDFEDEQRDCKVLLVSRDRHVLQNLMRVDESVEIQFLPKNEALNLFKNFVGGMIQPVFESHAIEIVKECGGLPIAIVTIACTLKNGDITLWKDILRKLKSCPIEAYQKAYQSIKISYDSLASDEEKMLLLLCSLHDEDANIYVENLLNMFAATCNLFQKMATLEEARNSVQVLLARLKDRCLLLNGDSPGTVKMHDVIRDIMVSVASKDSRMYCHKKFADFEECLIDGKLKDSIAISLHDFDFDQLPEELACPELKLLLVFDKVFANKKRSMLIPDDSFEAMKKLRALCICSVTLDRCPSSLCSLQNLQTLSLRGCKFEDIVLIGELKNLVVLDLSWSSVKLLPKQIGQLTRLWQLNLNHCISLQVIQPNALSSLVQLEELYMDGVYINWGSKGILNGDQRSNASLIELKNLERLRNLHLYIKDATSLPKEMFVGEKLERYHIIVGNYRINSNFVTSATVLDLKLKESSLSYQEYGFQTLIKKSEVLCLDTLPGVNNIAPQLNVDGFLQLRSLTISCNDEVRHIVKSCNSAFPNLEMLNLESLSNLEAIVYGRLTTEPFGRLRRIKVENCSKLKNVFSFSIARNLEEIQVHQCTMMKEIFYEESEDDVSNALNVEATDENIEFPYLRCLRLSHLQNLIQFFGSKNSSPDSPRPLFNKKVVFPTLKQLNLFNINCSALCLDRLPTSSFIGSLSSLSVEHCGNLKHLLTLKIGGSLKQLVNLEIANCPNMKELIVIHEEAEEEGGSKKNILFPSLRHLKLQRLKSLKKICVEDGIMECESLLTLRIEDCPELKTSISNCTPARAYEDIEQPLFIRTVYTQPLANETVAVPNISKQLHEMSIRNLQWLTISGCNASVHLLSFSAGESLAQLKGLIVSNCKVVEVIVMTNTLGEGQKGLSSLNDQEILFPKLESLELSKLPKLKMFCQGDRMVCPALLRLKIEDCDSLTTFFADSAHTAPYTSTTAIEQEDGEMDPRVNPQPLFNQKVVFPTLKTLTLSNVNFSTLYPDRLPTSSFVKSLTSLSVVNCCNLKHLLTFSIGRSLKQLEGLEISCCPNMEELIVIHEEVEEEVEEEEERSERNILFPKLRNLKLQSLKSLKRICAEDCMMECESLLTLRIEDCPELKNSVSNCTPARANEETKQPLFIRKVAVPNILKQLLQLSEMSTRNLQSLTISGCNTSVHLFSFSAVESLSQLKELFVSNCKVVEVIVMTKTLGEGQEGLSRLNDHEISFPKLERLKLSKLPKLKMFCGGDRMVCPSLLQLKIEDCDSLRTFVADSAHTAPYTSTTAIKQEVGEMDPRVNPQPLFNQEVVFPTLKTLTLSNMNFSTLCLDRLPTSFVKSLTSLSVDNCGNLKHLLTFRVSGSLKQLEDLVVRNCPNMEELIVIHEEAGEEGRSKKNTLFPRLRRIMLGSLKSLKRICAGDCMMECESLLELRIEDVLNSRLPSPTVP